VFGCLLPAVVRELKSRTVATATTLGQGGSDSGDNKYQSGNTLYYAARPVFLISKIDQKNISPCTLVVPGRRAVNW